MKLGWAVVYEYNGKMYRWQGPVDRESALEALLEIRSDNLTAWIERIRE